MSSRQFPHPRISSPPAGKSFVLATALLGGTLSALDVSIVNVTMPAFKTEFGISMAVLGRKKP